ncbi:hypothetical protein [Caldiplasma sukawensis]
MDENQNERIRNLLQKLSEVEPAIITVKKLQESGILAIIDALSEQSDMIFNYSSNMELLQAFSTFLTILEILNKILSSVDFEYLKEQVNKIPWNKLFNIIGVVLEFIVSDAPKVKPSSEKISTLKLLSEIKSPGMEFLIRELEVLSERLIEEMKENGLK